MCGGQYGYIIVSKFGLHQVATHSPICKKATQLQLNTNLYFMPNNVTNLIVHAIEKEAMRSVIVYFLKTKLESKMTGELLQCVQ